MVLKNLVMMLLALGWAAILFLVGGRFLALLFGANTDSALVERLYRHSDFWVKPFFNMFDLANKTVEDTGGVFEPASLIAFIFYFAAGLLVLTIVQYATAPFLHGGGHGRAAHDA
jgi:hypothetical protein